MKQIIVTGFEPFGGAERNASWEAVKELTGVRTVLLPVSFRRACGMVRELAAGEADAILCVGEAGSREKITIERIAVNLMDARIPDNDGNQPKDEPVCPGKPEARFSTLPVRTMLEAVPDAELSCTAGTYVCNAVFYTLMDEIHDRGNVTRGGFVHVPAKGMTKEHLAEALRCMIDVI